MEQSAPHIDRVIQKYLEVYAEPEIKPLQTEQIPIVWNEVVVLPARNETDDLYACIESLNAAAQFSRKRVLLILVLNGTEKDIDLHDLIIQNLHSRYPHELKISPSIDLHTHAPVDILVINRATSSFYMQQKEGVGLARKIGCDIALDLYTQGKILSPWIRNIDADVRVPDDYFFNPEEHKESAAAFLYNFVHNSQPLGQLSTALEVYDLMLRYYVEGIKWAGSPYAHHSLGSIIAVRAHAYASVRGFPKREAGEDFYLLNKLAKVGRIEENLGNPIRIEGRTVERVPFGTARKINEFGNQLANGEDVLFYNPLIFVLLKSWIDLITHYAESQDREFLKTQLLSDPAYEEMAEALNAIEAIPALEDLWGKSRSAATRLKHFHDWFDAFRTLKFVHSLRDSRLPSIQWSKAIESFDELTGGSGLRYKGRA